MYEKGMQQNIYAAWKTVYYKGKKPCLLFSLPLNVLVLMVYLRHLGHCCVSVHVIAMVTVKQGIAEVKSITHIQCRFQLVSRGSAPSYDPIRKWNRHLKKQCSVE